MLEVFIMENQNQKNWQFDNSKKPVTPDMLRLFDGLNEPAPETAPITQPNASNTSTVSVEPTVQVGDNNTWKVIHSDKTEPVNEKTSIEDFAHKILGDSPMPASTGISPWPAHVPSPCPSLMPQMPNAFFNPKWNANGCIPEMINYGGIHYTISGFDEGVFTIGDPFTIIDIENKSVHSGCILCAIDGISLEFKYINLENDTVNSLFIDLNDVATGKFGIYKLNKTTLIGLN
jgi:hypothetical protein